MDTIDKPVDLEPVRLENTTESETIIFDMLKVGVESPGDVHARAAALSEKIRSFADTKTSRHDVSLFLWGLWFVLVDMVSFIPADHPWQDTLAEAVQNLQQEGGLVGETGEVDCFEWNDLPHLAQYMLDKWADPTQDDTYNLEEVFNWKNMNSFTARLTTDNFAPWLTFPFWQIRDALEVGVEKGPVLQCRVWVATEWILRCGTIIFEEVTSSRPLDEQTLKYLAVGPLCKGISVRSQERLDFWEKRLTELADQKETLDLDSELVDRITKAAEKIRQFKPKVKDSPPQDPPEEKE